MALTQTEVSELYVTIFNRASEGEGNKYWQTNQPDMATTADVMLNTPDAKEYFGNSLNTNKDFVEWIYKNTLNKTANDDPYGISYWVNQLATKSRGQVIVELINAIDSYAPGGANYDANDAKTVAAYNQFTNRVKVSDHMADTVEKAPADYKTSTVFATSGDTGLIVTDDPATVTSAEAKIDSLSNPGKSFELAPNKDELVGTDGNDIFKGVISSLSSEKTLNPDDTIDGGKGDDTLNLDMKGNFSGLTKGNIKDIENINLTNSTTIARSFDAKNISDVKVYTLDSEKAINLSNLATADIEVSAQNMQNNFTIAFDSKTDLSGSSDKMALTFDGVGAAKVLNSDGTEKTAENDVKVTMANIEDVTLKSQNSASFIDLSGVDATKYTVTGDKDLTISKVKDGLTSIDASAMKGKLSINTTDIKKGSIKDITGGSNDDTIAVDAADILANATIVGGEGNDTLKISDSAGSTIQPKMSGVENLEITGVATNKILTISSKDITGLNSIVLDANSTDNGAVELVTQGSADITVKTVGAINAGQNLTLDTSGTVTFDVTGKDAKATAEETAAGTITAANSTSLNMNVDKYMTFTGDIVAGKATSLVINSQGDIDTNDSSDLSSLETLTITAGGDVNLATAGLNKVADITLSGTETTSAVTLGKVGDTATDYDVTLTSTGLKGGLTTGNITSKQNVNINLDGTTGDIKLADGNTIKSIDNAVIINAKNLTGTLETGAIKAKSVTIDASNSLKEIDIGNDANANNKEQADITVTNSFTYTAGLKAANSSSTHGVEIATTADATSTTFTLNGGIGDDAFAIQANNSAAATLTIKGDLGIGADQVVVTGSDRNGDSTTKAAITIDATGLKGSEKTALIGTSHDDTIKGSAGVDNIGGMAGKDTLTGGDGADMFIFRAGDSGTTDTTSLETADTITDFKSGDDHILFNYTYVAGSTPSGTATTTTNYNEATSAVADFSVAQTEANSALNGTVKVAFQYDTTNGYLFFDKDGNGTADEVVVLTGIDSTEIANTDILISS